MLKLKKFQGKKLTTKNIMISFAIMMVFMLTIIISKSYAIYKMQKEFDVIKSKVGLFSSGDVKVAVLVDGKETNEFPSYETNYKIESVECTNGVTGSFDVENWQVTIADMKATSTKCTVSFNSKETNEITPVNMSKTELIALNEEIKNTSAKQLANYLYPVGSIYMSTEDDTVEKVEDKFGGTWVKYAEDMTLIGASSSKAVNTTGGSSTVTLTTENLPSHSHVIPSLSGTTSTNGAHTHTLNNSTNVLRWNGGVDGNLIDSGQIPSVVWGGYTISANSAGEHSHTVTTTASNTTTCTNCNANPINIQNPYTVVYMYKRTA